MALPSSGMRDPFLCLPEIENMVLSVKQPNSKPMLPSTHWQLHENNLLSGMRLHVIWQNATSVSMELQSPPQERAIFTVTAISTSHHNAKLSLCLTN
jgi:hypothetical protein